MTKSLIYTYLVYILQKSLFVLPLGFDEMPKIALLHKNDTLSPEMHYFAWELHYFSKEGH